MKHYLDSFSFSFLIFLFAGSACLYLWKNQQSPDKRIPMTEMEVALKTANCALIGLGAAHEAIVREGKHYVMDVWCVPAQPVYLTKFRNEI